MINLESALVRAVSRGLKVNTVIDVGASDGRWTLIARKFFPDAQFLLIEPNQNHESSLQTLCSEFPNIDYLIAAAGDVSGEINFIVPDLFSGYVNEQVVNENTKVSIKKLDSLVKERSLSPPYLLKVNTNGAEWLVIQGAYELLKETRLIIMECYNFSNHNQPNFYEVCQWMGELHFRCIDIAEPLHRIKDRVFCQMKLFFIPDTNIEFSCNNYL